MDKVDQLVDLDDLYIELTQSLQGSLFSTKKQIQELKDFINNERREILKFQRFCYKIKNLLKFIERII